MNSKPLWTSKIVWTQMLAMLIATLGNLSGDPNFVELFPKGAVLLVQVTGVLTIIWRLFGTSKTLTVGKDKTLAIVAAAVCMMGTADTASAQGVSYQGVYDIKSRTIAPAVAYDFGEMVTLGRYPVHGYSAAAFDQATKAVTTWFMVGVPFAKDKVSLTPGVAFRVSKDTVAAGLFLSFAFSG